VRPKPLSCTDLPVPTFLSVKAIVPPLSAALSPAKKFAVDGAAQRGIDGRVVDLVVDVTPPGSAGTA
jgi:hypothetical protein